MYKKFFRYFFFFFSMAVMTFYSKLCFSNRLTPWVKQFLSNWLEILHTSLFLGYLVKYERVFWYCKNCPTYGQFLTIFFVKNTNVDFKLTQIYQYSTCQKSSTFFIWFIHYKQDFFFTARSTAVVLPATEHLKFRGSSAVNVDSRPFEKKLQKNFYTL